MKPSSTNADLIILAQATRDLQPIWVFFRMGRNFIPDRLTRPSGLPPPGFLGQGRIEHNPWGIKGPRFEHFRYAPRATRNSVPPTPLTPFVQFNQREGGFDSPRNIDCVRFRRILPGPYLHRNQPRKILWVQAIPDLSPRPLETDELQWMSIKISMHPVDRKSTRLNSSHSSVSRMPSSA